MAFVGENGGPGGSRGLCAEVNLVPFIDLLSMSICFLLMTAVWVQTSALEVRQSHGTESRADHESVELTLGFPHRDVITVDIRKGRSRRSVRLVDASADGRLRRLGAFLEMAFPVSGPGTDATAVLTADARVSYGELVRVMDVLRRHQFGNLGVSPKEVR
jgi:biopolymer transport protein ExbD